MFIYIVFVRKFLRNEIRCLIDAFICGGNNFTSTFIGQTGVDDILVQIILGQFVI